MATLGPLEWISAVECEGGDSYYLCAQIMLISACEFPSFRYCALNRLNLYTTKSITKQSGDYLIRNNITYNTFSVTTVSSVGYNKCTPHDTFSGTSIGFVDPGDEPYPFPAGDAETMCSAPIYYHRSDGTLVASWTFDSADICYSNVLPCPTSGGTDDYAQVVFKIPTS